MKVYVGSCLLLLAALGFWMYTMGRPAPPSPAVSDSTALRSPPPRPRATLNAVRQDWGVRGRLDCRVREVPEDR